MSLRPLADSARISSLQYVDGSLRSEWAQLLEAGKFRSALAEQVDDIVVLGLFSRITQKPLSRRFLPVLFSGRDIPLDMETIRAFRAITDQKQAHMLVPDQTYDRLLRETDSLGKELWGWGKNKLHLQGDYYARAALFCLMLRVQGASSVYMPHCSLVPVHLKVVQMGQTREASAIFVFFFSSFLSSYFRATLCSVHPGQELFVDYGKDFWGGHCPCNTCERLHHSSTRTSALQPAPSTSAQDDEEGRQIERRAKETVRRCQRRFKDIGKKRGKQAEE
ncbi:hypothetical protein B0H13DRAFT_1862223 [Mycena leptocephala]|nr:hypothetical protein B0H13DRAFT_1862223 [Mycena leptocephala]